MAKTAERPVRCREGNWETSGNSKKDCEEVPDKAKQQPSAFNHFEEFGHQKVTDRSTNTTVVSEEKKRAKAGALSFEQNRVA